MSTLLDQFLAPPPRIGYAPVVPQPDLAEPWSAHFVSETSLAVALPEPVPSVLPPDAVAELLLHTRTQPDLLLRIPVSTLAVTSEGVLLSGFDFTPLSAHVHDVLPTSWSLTLAWAGEGTVICHPLLDDSGEDMSRRLAHFTDAAGESRCIWTHASARVRPGDELALHIGEAVWSMADVLAGTIRSVHADATALSIRLELPNLPGGRWLGATFTTTPFELKTLLRSDVADCTIQSLPHATRMQLRKPFSDFSSDTGRGFWVLRAIWQDEAGHTYYANITAPPTSHLLTLRRLRLFFCPVRGAIDAHRTGWWRENRFRVGLSIDEIHHSGLRFRLRETAAFGFYMLFRPLLARRNVWLFYEKYGGARENAMAFFRYCVLNHVDRDHHRTLRYVCDPASPQYVANLADVDGGRVVRPDSFRHLVLALSARLLIGADTKYHAVSALSKESAILPYLMATKRLWFLEHGVKAFKFPDGYSARIATYMTCSNESEAAWMRASRRWPPENVVVTGLARWDRLVDRAPARTRPLVLVMPTFRWWLMNLAPEGFARTEYCRTWIEFLTSPELARWLEQRDLDLIFHTHPNLDHHIRSFATSLSPRIRVLSGDEPPLEGLIEEASLMVTDFSSIVFHGLFLDKPAIFYTFDRERVAASFHALVDFETDLPGPAPTTLPALLGAMEEAAARDWTIAPADLPRRDTFFAFRDRNNCQRILAAILARKL
ncbi:MAG: CDP-glycerol glycerophosphotransferase family protein [Kiritimatiellae bacterium]|nr:CDP-glycerol glycerophosphotransferase family protein [Kiritimatiellia bacterium]